MKQLEINGLKHESKLMQKKKQDAQVLLSLTW